MVALVRRDSTFLTESLYLYALSYLYVPFIIYIYFVLFKKSTTKSDVIDKFLD